MKKHLLLTCLLCLMGISQTWADDAKFSVNGTEYTSLSDADAAATTAGGATIIVTCDGELSGDNTISAGNTLLIPFDDANTLVTNSEYTQNYTKPSVYRTLTLKGTLTVNGNISVAAKTYAGSGGDSNGAGLVTGKYGCINMDGGKITLNSGANLYCWGFITGNGNVVAENGSTVYEDFQFNDYRGGTALFNVAQTDADYKVFPVNEYYVQNIECPLQINYGAEEKVTTWASASGIPCSATVNFVGSGENTLFRLKEGSYLKKWYDGDNDRQMISIYGDADIDCIELNLSAAGHSFTANSSICVLPLTYNMTITLEGGEVSLVNDAALLPGSVVNVEKDVTLTIKKDLFVYDSENWSSDFEYKNIGVKYAPGKGNSTSTTATSNPDAQLNVNGTVVVDGNLYTTNAGACICSSEKTGNITFTNGATTDEVTTYQIKQSGTDVTYVPVTVTAAQLQNSDGTYAETAGITAGATVDFGLSTGTWFDFKVYQGTESWVSMSLAEVKKMATNQNYISIASSGVDVTGLTNVLVKGADDEYTCSKFRLTDKVNFYSPVAFTAVEGWYTRDVAGTYASCCLPFAITSDMLGGGKILTYSSFADDDATFTEVSSLEAGKPCIVQVDGATWNATFNNTPIVASVTNDANSYGSFVGKSIDGDLYKLISDGSEFGLTYAASNPTVAPFRSYFSFPKASGAKSVNIVIEDMETGVNAVETADCLNNAGIYDVNGVKKSSLGHGVNIVKAADGSVRKVIVK